MRYEYNPFAGFFGSRKHILGSDAIVRECLFGDKDRAGLYEYLFIFPIITRILVDREIISKKSALGIFLSLISAGCFIAFAVTLALPMFVLGRFAAAFMKSKYSKALSPTKDILDATLVSENDMTMRDYIKEEFNYLPDYAHYTNDSPEVLTRFLSAKYHNQDRYNFSHYFDENLTLWQESTRGPNIFSLTRSDPKIPLLQIALVEKNIKAITAMRDLGIISSQVYSHAINDINSRRALITNIVSSTTSIVDIIMSYGDSYVPTAKRAVARTLSAEPAAVMVAPPALNTEIESLDEDENRVRLRSNSR